MQPYLANLVGHIDMSTLLGMVAQVAAILLCMTIHEASHGLAAYALGDTTAKSMNRLSLNPLHHIDPFGLLMMFVLGFGWAKPVPVNMNSFRNPRSGMAICAFAGPASNFILAFAAILLCRVVLMTPFAALFGEFLLMTAVFSIGLGVFNMIPIPPLDGSKVVFSVLPEKTYNTLMRYENIGMLALLALCWFGAGGGFISALIQMIFRFFLRIAGLL